MKPPKDTEFGRDLIAALEEGVAIMQGDHASARVHLAPDVPDVRAIRAALGLSREAFAARFGLELGAVRDWEQGLRKPDPAARTLLRVIAAAPDVVAGVVKQAA
jgi:putative transcriptional regulator